MPLGSAPDVASTVAVNVTASPKTLGSLSEDSVVVVGRNSNVTTAFGIVRVLLACCVQMSLE